jgi:hypothetical protein
VLTQIASRRRTEIVRNHLRDIVILAFRRLAESHPTRAVTFNTNAVAFLAPPVDPATDIEIHSTSAIRNSIRHGEHLASVRRVARHFCASRGVLYLLRDAATGRPGRRARNASLLVASADPASLSTRRPASAPRIHTKSRSIRPCLQTIHSRGLRPVRKRAPSKNGKPFIYGRIAGGVDGTRTLI